jgi:thiol-disulfide isomerase/thioredoxin
MVELSTPLPEFTLADTVSGRLVHASELTGRPLVVAFICTHCPYVLLIEDELVAIARVYATRGIGFVVIRANDPEQYPEDGPDEMKRHTLDKGFPFPYLFDASQAVARAFDAACIPGFFVYDLDGKLYYRGQLDEARPKLDLSVNGRDLRNALDGLPNGSPPPVNQRPSIGCNIKWKAA